MNIINTIVFLDEIGIDNIRKRSTKNSPLGEMYHQHNLLGINSIPCNPDALIKNIIEAEKLITINS